MDKLKKTMKTIREHYYLIVVSIGVICAAAAILYYFPATRHAILEKQAAETVTAVDIRYKYIDGYRSHPGGYVAEEFDLMFDNGDTIPFAFSGIGNEKYFSPDNGVETGTLVQYTNKLTKSTVYEYNGMLVHPISNN